MPVIILHMQYKAIVFDLDGTAIPLQTDGVPSSAVISTVAKAKERIIVCAATGRPITNAKPILEKLGLVDPCIISGGTQIINPVSKETLWEKRLLEKQVSQVVKLCKPYSFEILFGDELKGVSAIDKVVTGSERVIYLMNTLPQHQDEILEKLSKVDGIAYHSAGSWNEGKVDIHITHKEATKESAMKHLLQILNLNKSEVVAVGDYNNDIPLLNSAGYKVAMGNATHDLKQIADYIAPSVDEDGLAHTIDLLLSGKLPERKTT